MPTSTQPTSQPLSWGRLRLPNPHALQGQGAKLMVGARRSYGDVCALQLGEVQSSERHDRFVAWEPSSNIVCAQAGMRIGALCAWALKRGLFPPVVPGTQFATLGGCVANDVHGKNHHQQGSFGVHVRRLTLIRAGERLDCSPENHADLFFATLGGLGLTGEIADVSLQLMPMPSPWFYVRHRAFESLHEYFTLDEWFAEKASYSVSWLDCSPNLMGNSGLNVRGILSTAEPAAFKPSDLLTLKPRAWRFPFTPPFSLVRPFTSRAFNALYWRLPRSSEAKPEHYQSFLFPLDGVLEWNKVYGRSGFFQFQCVLPRQRALEGLPTLLQHIRRYGDGSPLVVLKQLGHKSSGGLISFPRAGFTLAIDFPNRGSKTLTFMRELENICTAFDGTLYPAKDACMSPASFQRHFPNYPALEALREPGRLSDFWLRMYEGKITA